MGQDEMDKLIDLKLFTCFTVVHNVLSVSQASNYCHTNWFMFAAVCWQPKTSSYLNHTSLNIK